MTGPADVENFGAQHREHGFLAVQSGGSTPNGYRLKVACPCGVTLERWSTPKELAWALVKLNPWNQTPRVR